MIRFVTAILASFIALMVLLVPAYSQTSGKIAGMILDAVSGDPMIDANLVIRGTSLGASTDLDGRFFILLVPPGDYTVAASYLGYRTTVIENVSVSTDRTTTLDIEMAPTALEAAEEVIYTAERPLIRKDQTSMESRVRAEELETMPVQDLEDVLDMQPGVIRDADGDIHIRGGRASEVSYLVNGISITDDYNKTQALDVANEAVSELQVISGTFNAEYGNAMSGVINLVTKSGSNQFHGTVETESGDYVSKRTDIFPYIDEIAPASITNQTLNLSGPIIRNKLTFFASLRQSKNEGWIYGTRRYLPQGRTAVVEGDTLEVSGDGAAVPMNDSRSTNGQVALRWQIAPNLILKTDFLGSISNSRNYSHDYRYNPNGYGYTDSYGLTEMAKLTYMLSDRSFIEFSFANRNNGSEYSLYDDPDDPRYVHPDSATYPSYAFSKAGTDLTFFERSTMSRIAKVNWTSQIDYKHQVKSGVEFQADEIFYDDFDLIPAENDDGQEIVPFKPEITPISQLTHDRYTRTPRKFAVFLQDKIEYESVVINVGLRLDWFEPRGKIPVDPQDPNVYQPLKLEHKYKDTDGNGAIDLSEQVSENEFSLEERRSFWYNDTTPKSQLSPRLGIAYPITDKGVIHFSYGIFQQIPEYSLLYDEDERKLSEGAGVYGPFGYPDLNPQRTTMYELGLSQQLNDRLAVYITGFIRDIRDWISTSATIPTSVASVSYTTRINRDLANVRGVTARVEGQLSTSLRVTADYTLQIAEGTNSAPEDEFWAQLEGAEPTKQLTPLNWDQRHTFNLTAHYSSEAYGLTLLGRYNSGQPYTPTILTGERTGRSIIAGLAENSRRMPPRFTVDLFAYRVLNVIGGRIRISAQVRNLFDSDSPRSVFTDTGLPDYTINEDLVVGADEGYFTRPDYYSEPRSILLGVRYEF